MLLLLALVACVVAAYWGELNRRQAAEHKLEQLQRDEEVRRRGSAAAPPRLETEVLRISDREQVHIKAMPPSVAARDMKGWRWRVYLPANKQWWLYVSQGEEWDASLGKYRDGSVSGSQIKAEGELELFGCLSSDFEAGRWIQNWMAGGSQAARLSDAGLAALRAPGETTRVLTGDLDQESSPIRPASHGRIQLFRWHKVLDPDAAADAAKSLPGRDKPPKEYGFSIYLVEESPLLRPPAQGN